MRREDVRTPAYIVQESALIKNLNILKDVKEKAQCHILLAQKCFSMFYEYPLIGQYLDGCTASGLYEARLGHECMGKENHVFSAGYRASEFDEILSYCDHVVFNSLRQMDAYKSKCREKGVSYGLRINPEKSTQEGHAIYDPCAPGSRFGVRACDLEGYNLTGCDGFHFHTLCEQNSDDLETTLKAVEEKFGKYLYQLKWVNFGGGHHITRDDYDRELLIKLVRYIKEKYNVEVYLEPGEAVALNAGLLKTEVIDIVKNGDTTVLITDTSAACHMPDVLEMPYRPPLKDSGLPGEKAYTYRLSSATCLSGDVIGDYSFDREIKIGDILYFEDMAIYSMVKNNTFNGFGLPDIVAEDTNGDCHVVKSFGYEDFKERLS